MQPVLEVRNLTSRLRRGNSSFKVIDNVSFSLYPSKTLCLVGESGCGKTMTALSVMRILPQAQALPSEGEILYRNQNLLSLPESEMRKLRGGRIAMIFQDPISALNPVFTIGDQLLEVVSLHMNLYGDEAIARIVKALEEVGISSPRERLYDYPHQISGGMKQRVMIAMALLCEPDILIADEPTTALDVTIQAQVLELIRELQKRRGMALLLITHDMGIVAEMADEVIVMYATESIEHGSVLQVFDTMAHPYTQGLFLSRPRGNKKEETLNPIRGSVPSLDALPSGCRFHPRCPYVMEKCRSHKVDDITIDSSPLHTVKCRLYDTSTESIEKLQVKKHNATIPSQR